MVSKGNLSKEDQRKYHGVHAVGTVAVTISEEGDVRDANVLKANSDKAAEFLLRLVKTMKFKPRPGCGLYKTEINLTPD